MLGLVVLVGAVAVVLLTSLIKRTNWSSTAAHALAVVLSVAGGVVGVLADNGWDLSAFSGQNLLQVALLVYAASQLIYGFIISGTVPGQQLDAKLTAVGSPEPGA